MRIAGSKSVQYQSLYLQLYILHFMLLFRSRNIEHHFAENEVSFNDPYRAGRETSLG